MLNCCVLIFVLIRLGYVVEWLYYYEFYIYKNILNFIFKFKNFVSIVC